MTRRTEVYRWTTATEWLHDKIEDTTSAVDLHAIALELLSKLNNDDIQQLFQTEMDEDGFFEEICDECRQPLNDHAECCSAHGEEEEATS